MSLGLTKCEVQVLRPTSKERATLAERLIAGLDTMDDAQTEQLWLEEADRRYQEYKKGRISARCADEVLRDIRRS